MKRKWSNWAENPLTPGFVERDYERVFRRTDEIKKVYSVTSQVTIIREIIKCKMLIEKLFYKTGRRKRATVSEKLS